jgi:hypothetical protein
MERAQGRVMLASKELDELCVSDYGVEFALVPFEGTALQQLTKNDYLSEESIVAWVTQFAPSGWFPSEEKRIRLVTLILKEAKSGRELSTAMDEVLKEDLGWPHRCAVYHDRSYSSSKRKKRDPQAWFSGCRGEIRAIQIGDDPDRYVPDIPGDNLTIVGRMKGNLMRFETKLDASSTALSVSKKMAAEYCFDPAHSILGYHGHPFQDNSINLMNFGVLPGTILHITPGWATVRDMELAQAKLDEP